MHESQETSRSRVVGPALLAILLIAAARADASMPGAMGCTRADRPTLRQITSLARVVQRLVEVEGERSRVARADAVVCLGEQSGQIMRTGVICQARPNHYVRDALLSLPPPF